MHGSSLQGSSLLPWDIRIPPSPSTRPVSLEGKRRPGEEYPGETEVYSCTSKIKGPTGSLSSGQKSSEDSNPVGRR